MEELFDGIRKEFSTMEAKLKSQTAMVEQIKSEKESLVRENSQLKGQIMELLCGSHKAYCCSW